MMNLMSLDAGRRNIEQILKKPQLQRKARKRKMMMKMKMMRMMMRKEIYPNMT